MLTCSARKSRLTHIHKRTETHSAQTVRRTRDYLLNSFENDWNLIVSDSANSFLLNYIGNDVISVAKSKPNCLSPKMKKEKNIFSTFSVIFIDNIVSKRFSSHTHPSTRAYILAHPRIASNEWLFKIAQAATIIWHIFGSIQQLFDSSNVDNSPAY